MTLYVLRMMPDASAFVLTSSNERAGCQPFLSCRVGVWRFMVCF